MGAPRATPSRFAESPHASHPPIRLGGSVLGDHRHICAFFNSREDDYRVTLPFIEEGFDRGDKAFHVVDPARRLDHLERIRAAGIDTDAAIRSGQFELLGWAETYLSYARFVPTEHLGFAEQCVQKARSEGYPVCRVITQMEWVVEHPEDVDLLLEYEARATDLWQGYPDPVICTYDLSKFRGDVVVDIMRTHPMVIIGGILQENPFFVRPSEFLSELRERQAARAR